MHLSQFLEHYVSRWVEPEYDPKGFGQFSYVTPVTPSAYLRYAQADLASGLKHAHINALSNAKRAIDCQLDNIFEAFGLKKRARFPEKLEIVGELGLLAPRIVRKVIKARNLLEHEYYDPPQSEVEDAVDIATLFVEAASRPFRNLMEDYFIADRASVQTPDVEQLVSSIQNGENETYGYTFTESFYVQFDTEERKFWIDCVHENKQVEEIQISAKHPFYKRMVRFSFDYDFHHHEYSVQEVGRAFISLMGELANEL